MNKYIFYLGVFLSIVSTGMMSLVSYLHVFNIFILKPAIESNERTFLMPVTMLILGIVLMVSGIVIKED